MLPVNKVHLDLTSLLTTLAQNAVVVETRGLTRCLLSETTTKNGQKETVLNTEGINVHELIQHSDVRREMVEHHLGHTCSEKQPWMSSVNVEMSASIFIGLAGRS